MGIERGELVGNGRTCDVYAYGRDSVIKIPHASVPHDWAVLEAEVTRAVTAHGLPAPAVRDLIEFDGRPAIVFERIHGPSLWQQMLDEPDQVHVLATEFAAIHQALLAVGPPTHVPDLVDRLLRKLTSAAEEKIEIDLDEVTSLLDQLPRGAALLHGDLHPGNILMGPNGPVVIDWFDATVGHPIADIVRSAILIHPARWAELRHLPGANLALLNEIQRGYLQTFADHLDFHQAELPTWQALIAASRLAEHAEVDDSGLIELWHERRLATASALPQAAGTTS